MSLRLKSKHRSVFCFDHFDLDVSHGERWATALTAGSWEDECSSHVSGAFDLFKLFQVVQYDSMLMRDRKRYLLDWSQLR